MKIICFVPILFLNRNSQGNSKQEMLEEPSIIMILSCIKNFKKLVSVIIVICRKMAIFLTKKIS